MRYYADPIINILDPNDEYISHRFYRDSCIIKHEHYIKDLRIIKNRDLKNMVIVDNSIVCFYNQLNNGIYVPSYHGDKDDNKLEDVINLLKEIAYCEDVRNELEKRTGLNELFNSFISN